MRPTDDMLNRAMAEALGWRMVTPEKPAYCKPLPFEAKMRDIIGAEPLTAGRAVVKTDGWANTNTSEWKSSIRSDFCRDRNTLPEILDAVEAAGKQWGMATRLDKDLGKGVVESAWIMWRLPMRDIVIAALRALGKWPDDWSDDE